MTNQQVADVCSSYLATLTEDFGAIPDRNLEADERPEQVDHVAWMCTQVPLFMAAQKVEKAMRWLGFIQGVMWTLQIRSLVEMKADNA